MKQNKYIEGEKIILRSPMLKDAEEFIENTNRSSEFHKGLTNPPNDIETFTKYVERNNSEAFENFLICEKSEGKIIGVINISQIFYGGFESAYLGYYLFEGFQGRGFMSDALKSLLKFAFEDLKLHRLEANIQPHNTASIKLVKRAGFVKEGFSPKYLKIDGKWCDHERWAIIFENWSKN